jgi:hypothetical protein
MKNLLADQQEKENLDHQHLNKKKQKLMLKKQKRQQKKRQNNHQVQPPDQIFSLEEVQ